MLKVPCPDRPVLSVGYERETEEFPGRRIMRIRSQSTFHLGSSALLHRMENREVNARIRHAPNDPLQRRDDATVDAETTRTIHRSYFAQTRRDRRGHREALPRGV